MNQPKRFAQAVGKWAAKGACPHCLEEILDQFDAWPTAHTPEIAAVIENTVAATIADQSLDVAQAMIGRLLELRAHEDELANMPSSGVVQ